MKSLKTKLNNLLYCLFCFRRYVLAGIRRWFAPRTYFLAYSFQDRKGNTYMDSQLVAGVVPNIRDVMAHLQKDLAYTDAKDLRVLAFTEAPVCLFKGICIDAASKLVEKVDKQADELKQQAVIKPDAAPTEPEEDEDGDISELFK